MIRIPTHRPPTHPGEMLAAEFLTPAGETPEAFAVRAGFLPQRVRALIAGTTQVDGRDAQRLSDALGTSPQFWLNLQASWDQWSKGATHGA